MDLEVLIADFIRDLAELPDRTSPEDQPDALLVTRDELRARLRAFAEDVTALEGEA